MLNNEISKFEAVHESFTKYIGNLRLHTYNDRLVDLKLDSLQYRRVKADLMMCYKIFNVLVYVNSACF